MFCSRKLSLASTGSGIASTGPPTGGADGAFGPVENESRWISACLDALRLISRSPTKSPLLKLPLPCLNSHKGESGEPLWKTSLTMPGVSAAYFVHPVDLWLCPPLWNPYMFNCRTKDDMLVCLKYDLDATDQRRLLPSWKTQWALSYDRTLENSLEGDITKLSFVLDHEIKCWMLWSSSMLHPPLARTICKRVEFPTTYL